MGFEVLDIVDYDLVIAENPDRIVVWRWGVSLVAGGLRPGGGVGVGVGLVFGDRRGRAGFCGDWGGGYTPFRLPLHWGDRQVLDRHVWLHPDVDFA
jgi:hypothetical protein